MSTDLYLYASIGSTLVALPASQVEAVVRLADIVPVQSVPDYVRGLAALRSRVLTIIDMQARVSGVVTQSDGAPLAVVAEVAGHAYGLIVTGVRDIAAAAQSEMRLQGRIGEAWMPYTSSVIIHEGRSHLVLSVDDFVSAGQGAAIAA